MDCGLVIKIPSIPRTDLVCPLPCSQHEVVANFAVSADLDRYGGASRLHTVHPNINKERDYLVSTTRRNAVACDWALNDNGLHHRSLSNTWGTSEGPSAVAYRLLFPSHVEGILRHMDFWKGTTAAKVLRATTITR